MEGSKMPTHTHAPIDAHESAETRAPIEITFTQAYDQLRAITEKLNSSDTLPPEQLLELLKTGKGLEHVLRTHLDEVEQQVQEIEAGERYVPFRIVPATHAQERLDTSSGQPTGTSSGSLSDGDELPF